ncbi:hypothetical protein LLH00_09710 [bacterium]|nr:hypothetical protein [bacterium]
MTRMVRSLFLAATVSSTLLLLAGGCSSVGRVSLNPTVNLAVAPTSLADQAAVYIPSLQQKQVYSQTISGLGSFDVELGPSLIRCTQESFQLFFSQVLMLGPSETTSLPWRIDLRTDHFRITENLGADLQIWCKVVHSGKIVLDQGFTGHADGPDQQFRQLDSARKVIQQSAESAFQQAFVELQKALREKTAAK